jgi:hypothetical protein
MPEFQLHGHTERDIYGLIHHILSCPRDYSDLELGQVDWLMRNAFRERYSQLNEHLHWTDFIYSRDVWTFCGRIDMVLGEDGKLYDG